jgi:GTPase SAR1 family protein
MSMLLLIIFVPLLIVLAIGFYFRSFPEIKTKINQKLRPWINKIPINPERAQAPDF